MATDTPGPPPKDHSAPTGSKPKEEHSKSWRRDLTEVAIGGALLRVAGVAACAVARKTGARDLAAEKLLAAVIAAVEKHDKALWLRWREHQTAAIAERVAVVYQQVRDGRQLSDEEYDDRLRHAFMSEHGEQDLGVPAARMQRLRIPPEEVLAKKGPKEAAMFYVGWALGTAPRAAYQAQAAGFPFVAFDRTTGALGVLRYVLALLGWGSKTAPNVPRGWTPGETCAALALVGLGTARIDELTGRRLKANPASLDVARNVRALLATKGRSPDDLAASVGLRRDYLDDLERGVVVPTLDILTRLAAELGVGVLDLLAGEGVRDQLFEATRDLPDKVLRRLLASAQRASLSGS